MLNAYSLNVTVPADSAIPLNSVRLDKGCEIQLVSPATINLNRRGLYEVTVNASSAASSEVALTQNGTVVPNTAFSGTSSSFTVPVQVSENNTCCCCTAPVTLQVVNTADAPATYAVVNVYIKKVC